jgi:aspartate racemase
MPRILGVVGGIAPISTVAYYEELIAQFQRAHPTRAYPQIVINSINLRGMLDPIIAGDYDAAAAFLTREVVRLADAGVELALFASNTPHLVFDKITAECPIPLISIVRTACAEARRRGLKRLCLLGNRFVMAAQIYQQEAAALGITIVVPSASDREEVDGIYMGDLIYGRFTDSNRERMLRVIDRVAAAHPIDGIILGGTELPLLLTMPTYGGIQLLDTMKIHVAAAVEQMLT